MVPTRDLVPYANNARIHSAEQVDTICASIEEFGFNDPVGVWTNAYGELEIVEGHGRVMAAEQLGIEKVPTVNLDHLTDEQRRAYSIVHNQTTDNSEFDFAMLDLEMMNLDFDFSEFGIPVNNESVSLNGESGEGAKEYPLASMELRKFEHHDYIVFVFDNVFDWTKAASRFGLERYDFGLCGTEKVGLGRVVSGERLIEELGD